MRPSSRRPRGGPFPFDDVGVSPADRAALDRTVGIGPPAVFSLLVLVLVLYGHELIAAHAEPRLAGVLAFGLSIATAPLFVRIPRRLLEVIRASRVARRRGICERCNLEVEAVDDARGRPCCGHCRGMLLADWPVGRPVSTGDEVAS